MCRLMYLDQQGQNTLQRGRYSFRRRRSLGATASRVAEAEFQIELGFMFERAFPLAKQRYNRSLNFGGCARLK